MKMSEVSVGDRLKSIYSQVDFDGVTVTEITARGFRYTYDFLFPLNPYEYAVGGEHYGLNGECLYRLATEEEKQQASPVLLHLPSRYDAVYHDGVNWLNSL